MELRVKKVILKDQEVKRIYKESFLKKERMPFLLMLMLSKMGNTDFLSFYDQELLCGFTYMATIKNVTFIMFFAVDQNVRSKGYGSSILQKIQSLYPNNKIIVSIERCDEEAVNLDQRNRRKKFYLNNGFIDTSFLIDLANTKQEILIKNGEFDSQEFSDFFKRYSNGTMRPIIWKK